MRLGSLAVAHSRSTGRARSLAPLATAGAAMLFAFASLRAQAAATRGTLDGIVTDTSLAPLAGASAWILGTKLQVSAGDNGRFRITGIPAGTYIVVIRRLGYAPLSSAVSVAAGDTTRASFALVRQDIRLQKVVVNAAAGAGPLGEFESRRALGMGQFMTQSQIEKLNFVGTSDLLRTFHSVAVGTAAVSNTRLGALSSRCPMQFFVDGVAITVTNLERDLPPPHELAGIEVHANTATVPLQYASLGGGVIGRGGGFCGVILLWTKY